MHHAVALTLELGSDTRGVSYLSEVKIKRFLPVVSKSPRPEKSHVEMGEGETTARRGMCRTKQCQAGLAYCS
jgi:hypothetical protein